MKALVKNRTSGIAERGIVLGNGVPLCTPGKIEDGIMYCMNTAGGGCIVVRTTANLLLAVYDENPTSAAQIIIDCADHMKSTGR